MELFAGIGGFRVGIEAASHGLAAAGHAGYEVVYANQWEPNTPRQWAAKVYSERFGDTVDNRSIEAALSDPATLASLIDAAPNVLTAGFPCQDYSTANTKAQGLAGAKGALWWQIVRALRLLHDAGKPVTWLMLENVAKLLASPSGALRGLDFAIILRSLEELGYAVAWRVINSGAYGFPQRRIRIYMVCLHQSSTTFTSWKAAMAEGNAAVEQWLLTSSPLVQSLPAQASSPLLSFRLPTRVKAETVATGSTVGAATTTASEATQPEDDFSETWAARPPRTDFANTGLFWNGQVWTLVTEAACQDVVGGQDAGDCHTLGDVVCATGEAVHERFFLNDEDLPRWTYIKGAKREKRVTSTGFEYEFTEGAIAFPEPLDKPSRTLLTSCSGKGVSRTTLVVRHPDGRLRLLTPEELEALSGFPRGFTAVDGIPEGKRGFLVGNAVVTGVIARLAEGLALQASGSVRP